MFARNLHIQWICIEFEQKMMENNNWKLFKFIISIFAAAKIYVFLKAHWIPEEKKTFYR